MKKIINLTPHEIMLAGKIIPTSGIVCRAKALEVEIGNIDGIPVIETAFGEVEGLPDPVWHEHCVYWNAGCESQDGAGYCNDPASQNQCGVGTTTIFIVSSLAAQAIKRQFPDRKDYYVPSRSVRDETGKIVGCEALGKV